VGQLQALVGLRWRMVRSRRSRGGLIALLGVLLFLLVGGVVFGQTLPPGKRLFDLLLLTPTLFVVFLGLAVIAPLVAGGGNELYPEDQLVAYPIEARTVFGASVLMAPLNLAWALQLVVLVTATAAVSQRGSRVLLAELTTVAYVVAATAVGQALAWTVVGLRRGPAGRRVTHGLALALFGGLIVVLATGRTTTLLDSSPTGRVVVGAIAGSQGRYALWCATTLSLVVLAAVAGRLGTRACRWALRRAAPAGSPELVPVTRRAPRRSVLAELSAVDRASVWRSTSLRRGCLVLAALPGGVAMLAHPTWISLTLLPGLVAAGAGLLFGVNAFCLDGGGAVFVATQPHNPTDTLVAKLLITAQTCFVAVLLAVVLAATQVREAPSAAEVMALVGSVVGTTMLVVAACGRLSVERPHKADLRGPRDTPAPPATMAVYSLRLALGTTWAGLAFAGAGGSGSVTAASAACVAVLAVAARSLVRTLANWRSEAVRARVVTTVAFG
jgi:hypothetical protein